MIGSGLDASLKAEEKMFLDVTYSQQFHDEFPFFFILVFVFFLHFFHFALKNQSILVEKLEQ